MILFVHGDRDVREPQVRPVREDINMNATQQLNEIARIVNGKAWGADKGKHRVYLPSRRDIKTFISFDVAENLSGAKLNVFIDDCGQHANWYASEKLKAMGAARFAINAAVWFLATGNAEEAEAIFADKIEFDDTDMSHVANGRLDVARKSIFVAA